jgi:ABC-type multidrug transport system ATPase subunit
MQPAASSAYPTGNRSERGRRLRRTPTPQCVAVALFEFREQVPVSEEIVLEVDGLTKDFGRQRALDRVSFSVRRGDILGFLGLNGAGKTTTIRICLGLLFPDAGKTALFGHVKGRGRLAALARVGAMVEGPAFYDHLTGAENLRLLGRLSGPIDNARVDDILTKVGLDGAKKKRAREYSLGMKQRLGIALALISRPEFVILDEPTNGLDPNGILEMRKLVQDLNRDEGVTFLVSSHLLHEIEMTANRVVMIEKGKVLVTDTVQNLLASMNPLTVLDAEPFEAARAVLSAHSAVGGLVETPDRRSFRFKIGKNDVADLVRALVAAKVSITRIAAERPTLEEYFLSQSTSKNAGALS